MKFVAVMDRRLDLVFLVAVLLSLTFSPLCPIAASACRRFDHELTCPES